MHALLAALTLWTGGTMPGPRSAPTPCQAPARACVDTQHQQAWLQDGGQITYGPVPVALGGSGHRTPHGQFRVAWKAESWTSTEYGIAMPWSVFFTTGGIAFHAGPLRRQSHGCVH